MTRSRTTCSAPFLRCSTCCCKWLEEINVYVELTRSQSIQRHPDSTTDEELDDFMEMVADCMTKSRGVLEEVEMVLVRVGVLSLTFI